MNNSDDINLDLGLGRPLSPSSSGVDPSPCRYDLQSSLFQTLKMSISDDINLDLCLGRPSPPSSRVEPSAENYEMNNFDDINLDLRLGRPYPEKGSFDSAPSSSAVDPSPCKYDVFISFRGEDTRRNFTSFLYNALRENNINAYIDEIGLEKGDAVSRALRKAIEESTISIVVFSTNYAFSTWCLDELLHILKCHKEKSQIVLPIFLGVDPSDIRKQKRSYAAAFDELEKRPNITMDKAEEWKQALIEASGFSGWDSQVKSESDIVHEVVKDVKEKLKHIGSNGGIEDLLKSLKQELRLANRVLDDAEEKQLTDEDVRDWLLNMKEVNYRADELTDKINCEELRRQLGGASESSTSFARFKKLVEDEIAKISSKLKELDAQKDKLGLKELTEKNVSQRSYGAPLVLDSEVYGRGDDKEAILKLLLSDDSCGDKVPMVLPIVGMGGIGKTTLAQLVYNDPRVKCHFQIRVWVTVSTEFDVLNITKQIYKRVIKPQFDTDEVFELQGELSEALEGKKYLFVLDDVWNEDYVPWDDLRRPFKSGKSGSKIIITTRSSEVASTMSKVEAHNLNGLSDESCWKIFIQHAFKNEDLLNADSDLQKIGEGIVQKCKGLPLAVKSVAALLRSISSPDEWRKILENPIWDSKLPGNARKVLPALWLSYRHLSPPPLKRCFAYCSIFPKDYEFDKKHLILLWMGEGLLEASGGTRMEDVGEEYFKILTSISFFQPSVRDESCFIMHDCVHDLATFVLGDFGFQLEKNNLHNLPSKTRHLSIMQEMIHHLEEISTAKCLRTFLALGSSAYILFMAMPLKLLLEEGCLRVLSLHHSGIAELPDSIGNLKHLRYLDVSQNSIKEIPDTICTLYNLETLLLTECTSLTRLPTDIGNLKHLRYLDVCSTSIEEIPDTICTLQNLETLLLKHCRMLTRLPTDIVCLIKLRHLDFSGSPIIELPLHILYMKYLQTLQPICILGKEHAGLRIRGLEKVVDVKHVCEAKLRENFFITDLGFYWDGDSEDSMKETEILDQLQPHTNLEKLCIFGYSGTRLSGWMQDQSFSSIVQVDLIRCNCRSLWPLDQLPSLKTLKIEESFRRVETINWEFFSNSSSMTKPFRSLQVLRIDSMLEWKEWLFREGEVVFPTLKELRLSECPKLEVRLLPDCFPSLTRLEVISCRQVMLIPATHQGLIFPSLQELEIRECPEQELILEGGLPSSLETITIYACDNLKALDNNGFRLLTSLRKLKIEYCYDLQCLPKLPSYPFDVEIIECPFLYFRWQENGEDCLKIGFYWDDDSEDSMKEREILDQLQPHTNLKKLYIKDYPGTRFSDWMGDQSFSSIVQVKLSRCYNCRSLWPLDQLPSLKTLLIEDSFRRVETIDWEFFSNSSSMTKPFRSLQVLRIDSIFEWKEWLFREGEVVFPTLKELRLSECPKLEVRLLPDCFPSLTRLEVISCRQVMLIPATHQGLIFPSLQELAIRECPEQELILEGGLPSSLETITISRCYNLKALDNNGFRLLTSLRKLKIAYCDELQCLPELPSYPFDLEIKWCPLLDSRCQENGADWLKIKHARLKLSAFGFDFDSDRSV